MGQNLGSAINFDMCQGCVDEIVGKRHSSTASRKILFQLGSILGRLATLIIQIARWPRWNPSRRANTERVPIPPPEGNNLGAHPLLYSAPNPVIFAQYYLIRIRGLHAGLQARTLEEFSRRLPESCANFLVTRIGLKEPIFFSIYDLLYLFIMRHGNHSTSVPLRGFKGFFSA